MRRAYIPSWMRVMGVVMYNERRCSCSRNAYNLQVQPSAMTRSSPQIRDPITAAVITLVDGPVNVYKCQEQQNTATPNRYSFFLPIGYGNNTTDMAATDDVSV